MLLRNNELEEQDEDVVALAHEEIKKLTEKKKKI